MQVLKKILSLTLACALTLSMGAVTAFANPTTTTAGTEAELIAALAAASNGDTITLTGGFKLTSTLIIRKNITIDGGNVTLDASGITTGYPTADNKHGVVVENATVTLENLTVSKAAGYGIQIAAFQTPDTQKLTLSNVTVLDSKKGGLLVNQKGTTTNITNCTFSGNAWGDIDVVKGCTVTVDADTKFETVAGKPAVWIDGVTVATLASTNTDISVDGYAPIDKNSNVWFVKKPTVTVTGFGEGGTTGTIVKADKLFEKSSNKGEVIIPEGSKPKDKSTINVKGNDYPNNIRLDISVAQPNNGSTLQLIAESNGKYYDVVALGNYGGAGGYKPANATTDLYFVATAVGDYTIVVKTIDVKTTKELSVATCTLTVVDKKEELTGITPPADFTLDADVTLSSEVITALNKRYPTAEITTNTAVTKNLPLTWTLKSNTTFNAVAGATNTYTWTATLPIDLANVANVALTGDIVVTNNGLPPSITSVAVSPKTASVEVGETKTLTAKVVAVGGAVDTVTWKSSDDKIATVAANGVVTGVAEGTATITATSTVDNTKSDTAAIIVTAKKPTPVPVTGVTVSPKTLNLSIGVSSVTTGTLKAKITPDDATNKNVKWTSSDDTVATVDEDGVVTANNKGETTITVTTVDGSETATCEVTVTLNEAPENPDPEVPENPDPEVPENPDPEVPENPDPEVPEVPETPTPDDDKPSGGSSAGSDNTANKPETVEKVKDTVNALKDPEKALPADVAKTTTAGGKEISTIPVALTSGSASVGMDLFNTLGDSSSSVGLKFTVKSGLVGGSMEVIIPGGFGKITEPGRIGYSMDFADKAASNDDMLKAVKGESVTSTTAKIGGNQTLPVTATITVATKVANGTTVNIYKYDPHTKKFIVIGKAIAKDGKLTFGTKIMGEMLFTTGTI